MVLLTLMTTAGASAALAQPAPSFDCAKARAVAERLICAEPDLAKADREVAAAYRRAAAAVQTATDRDTLARHQVEWLKGRDEACLLDDTKGGGLPPPAERRWTVSCLLAMHGYRTSALDDVAGLGHVPGPASGAPAPSLEGASLPGRYATAGFGWYGSMTIVTDRDGLVLTIESVTGATAHICSLTGKARIVDEQVVAIAYHDPERPREDERCTVSLSPISGGFRVAGQDSEQCRSFCGARGTLSGDYYQIPSARR